VVNNPIIRKIIKDIILYIVKLIMFNGKLNDNNKILELHNIHNTKLA